MSNLQSLQNFQSLQALQGLQSPLGPMGGPQGLTSISYTPACSQYVVQPGTTGTGAIVKINNQISVGNCTANNINGDPRYGPYDFACITGGAGAGVGIAGPGGQKCINLSSGYVSNSPNGICCQQPSAFTVPETSYVLPWPPRPRPPPPNPSPLHHHPEPPYPPPLPNPHPLSAHCLAPTTNDCARILDQQQGVGVNNAAAHFNNMKTCQTQCGYGSQGLL